MKLSRRLVLKGAFGVSLALPLLEGQRALAQSAPRFAVFMRQANGVAQQSFNEPERFWPRQLGALTAASLGGVDADRAVSELKDYASKLLLVRGLKFAFDGNGCGHSGGGNQCLTAARVSTDPSGNLSLAMGESVDNRIARELNPPGREPLTLYAGYKSGYINEVLSYRGPKDLRPAENNPFNAYSRMVGLTGADAATRERVAKARLSVNDLVREQLKAVLSRKELSQDDRSRVQLHLDSVRDLEVQMACNLSAGQVQAMQAMAANNNFRNGDNIDAVVRMQSDLIALAFACGYTRAATLQIGDGNDATEYTFGGVRQPNFHFISHRILSHGAQGTAIDNAQGKHHEIDRIHARMFKYLLDKLAAYSILDDTAAVWTNDLAHGVSHSYLNVPFVIAGSCGGYLRTGRYVDVGNVPQNQYVAHNQLFNTLLNAVGCRKADGAPVDDFGDASLPKGELSALKA